MISTKFNSLKSNYECVIIGGGIVGAGILRDLALNGIETLLIEKKEFSSQTSKKSSKMLHGGIRYLENMDFDLVFEALREKNLWIKRAPKYCYDSAFYLPIYKDSLRPKWMIACGLFLYDLLSLFQNTPFKMANKEQTLKALRDINPNGLMGAGIYHDAVMDDEMITLKVIESALKCANAHAVNFTELKTFRFINNKVQIIIENTITHEEKEIWANEIVFATGPFTDDVLLNHPDFKWTPKLLQSKGSHLWLKKEAMDISSPLVLTPNDGRVIFVIPQHGKILVGTTEVEHQGDKFDLEMSEEEKIYLFKNIKEFFPNAKLSDDMILGHFAGLRPLVKEDDAHDRGKTARNHKYYQPRHNMHVIIGGKYTTFRVMAQDVCKIVCKKLERNYNSLLSMTPF